MEADEAVGLQHDRMAFAVVLDQLLSQGAAVNPGVVTGAVGTLTVAGRYAFATNAVGQAPAGRSLGEGWSSPG